MSVNNALARKDPMEQTVTYDAGNEKITLSPSTVRNFLVNGNREAVTTQEIVMFLNLCKFQHLNPFLREAYLVKYGNDPATMVVGKDAFAKRAQRNAKYKGFQAGVIVQKADGTLENRTGSLVLDGEAIVGGWAKVYVSGYEVPIEASVSYSEYEGKKFDRETREYVANRQWKSKPATMIRKVALVQALREAFPDDFAGMYDADEMGIDAALLNDRPVALPQGEERTDIEEPYPDEFDPLA